MDIKKQPIIDFHIHPYFTYEENACMCRDQFNLTPDECIEDLKNAGINHVCGSVIKPGLFDVNKGFEQIIELNREALKFKEIYGEYYTPGFHIHPGFLKESLEEVEFMHRQGVKLVGELVPYQQGWEEMGFDYSSKELWEILQLAGEYDMIVSYHTILKQNDEINKMLENNPKVTFVMAHPGQRADLDDQLERLKKYPNAYLDLSGTGINRYGMIHKGVKLIGSERLVFGTDYPISNPGMYVQAVMYERISDEDRENIFYNNAKRLLDL